MAFKFKLEALLKLKVQVEDSVKTKLGKAIQELENQKNILSNYENEKINHFESFAIESAKGIVASKLKEFSNYNLVLIEKIDLQKEKINKAEKNVDIIREELIKVVHDRKIMEKLKEKKKEEYLNEQIKNEQIINDEITSFKYSKKMTENTNNGRD